MCLCVLLLHVRRCVRSTGVVHTNTHTNIFCVFGQPAKLVVRFPIIKFLAAIAAAIRPLTPKCRDVTRKACLTCQAGFICDYSKILPPPRLAEAGAGPRAVEGPVLAGGQSVLVVTSLLSFNFSL